MLLTRFRPEFSDGVVDLIPHPPPRLPRKRKWALAMCMTISSLPAASAGRPGASACAWVKAPACITLAISATTWTRPGEGITTRPGPAAAAGPAHCRGRQVLGGYHRRPGQFCQPPHLRAPGLRAGKHRGQVPAAIRDRWEISAVKCRYIWRIDSTLKLDL